MDLSHSITRLADEQQKALSTTQIQLQQWKKFEDDYVTVQKRLKTLPEQTSHQHMVPFGPLAFMPGHLIHTNEILVLLGDNWFAEMSAVQACDVIDRRLKEIKKSLEELEGQKRLLEGRAEFTHSEFSSRGEVDLVEEYDSDKEHEWQIKHKENVKKHKQKTAASGCKTDGEVLKRLETLELRERSDKELEKLNRDEVVPEADIEGNSAGGQKKTVHWDDKPEPQALHLDVMEESSSLDSDDSRPGSPFIYFKHSPRDEDGSRLSETPDDTDPVVTSPRDLHTMFAKPRSILKNVTVTHTVTTCDKGLNQNKSNQSHDDVMKSDQLAVQHTVVERPQDQTADRRIDSDDGKLANQTSEPPANQTTVPPDQPRVSKFKAMRKKKIK